MTGQGHARHNLEPRTRLTSGVGTPEAKRSSEHSEWAAEHGKQAGMSKT